MSLYSLRGAFPEELPNRIRLPDGSTRTDPSSFSTEEIAAAGYILVSDAPVANSTHRVIWDSENIEWKIVQKTPEQYIEYNEMIKKEITKHRDQLIMQGFFYNGVKFDSRPEDQKRISGAALLAFMAVTAGAQANNYLWHGGSEPFVWIAQDNSVVQMDAFTVIDFAKTAAFHESGHVFAARNLKNMNPIPEDYTNPIYWP